MDSEPPTSTATLSHPRAGREETASGSEYQIPVTTPFTTALITVPRPPCSLTMHSFTRPLASTSEPPGRFHGPDCHDQTVPTTFTLTTRARHRAEELFDLSLSVDTHLSSMARSDEQAIA